MQRDLRMMGLMLALTLAACSDAAGSGRVEVRAEGDDGIREGIAAGSEGTVDGWSVTFDRYVVAIGHVEIEGGGPEPLEAHTTFVVDLAKAANGLEVATFEGVRSGAWPELRYETPIATADATRDPSVSQADFDRMVAEGCTYLLRGTLANPSGSRCVRGDSALCTSATQIAFDLCVPAEAEFGPCESDTGVEGIVVTEGGTTLAALTIHGDHLFFNGFPEGAEGSVVRRAQWLANADVDADGTVTRADLESITSSDFGALFPARPGDGLPGYDFGAAPEIDGAPIASAWGYARAQLQSQGHFQGEGECARDGMAHAH